MTIELYEQNKNSVKPHAYSKSYQWLHWLMALSILTLLIAGQQFNFDLTLAERLRGLKLHSSVGSCSFIIVLFLIVKRFIKRDPAPIAQLPKSQILMSKLVQLSLYSIALLIPLTGMMAAFYSPNDVLVFGVIKISLAHGDTEMMFSSIREIHRWATRAAILLVLCHGGAAIYHHLILKDGILLSMLDIRAIINRLCSKK